MYPWLCRLLAMTCAELSALVVRDAIEAAPIAPLSLEARAVGDVGTMTLPNRIADTVAVLTS